MICGTCGTSFRALIPPIGEPVYITAAASDPFFAFVSPGSSDSLPSGA